MSVKDTTVSHKVDIPHEPGEWMEFRELGWKTLEAAREIRSRNSLLNVRDLGPEFLKSLTSTEDSPEVKEVPTDTYDKGTLLRTSILNWSYIVPCTEANIDSLDPITAAWAFDEIIKIHFPTEDEAGKVSESSNAPSQGSLI